MMIAMALEENQAMCDSNIDVLYNLNFSQESINMRKNAWKRSSDKMIACN